MTDEYENTFEREDIISRFKLKNSGEIYGVLNAPRSESQKVLAHRGKKDFDQENNNFIIRSDRSELSDKY